MKTSDFVKLSTELKEKIEESNNNNLSEIDDTAALYKEISELIDVLAAFNLRVYLGSPKGATPAVLVDETGDWDESGSDWLSSSYDC